MCGQAITSPRSWLRRGYGTICSDACRERWRLQRGRGRNGLAWEQVVEQLRGLEPGMLDTLPPPTPEILRLFYGLVDGTPWTQAAIGRHLNLPKARIQKMLTGPAVTRLLGEPGHRADRQRVRVPCAICGATVERAPRELRDRVETTCGASCRRELQRRQVSRLTGNAAARSRRLEHLREKTSTPEFREAIRQRALRRYRPYAEVLAALPPEAFAELGSSERNLVRQYYGLDRDPPRMLAELAADLRQSQKRVRQRITQAVAQLQAIGGLFDAGCQALP